MSTWAYPYLFLHPAYVIFRLVLEHIPTYFYTLRMLYSDEYLSISLPISTSCVCYIQMSTWAYPYLFLHPAYFIFRWVLEHIPTYFYSLHPAYVIFRWVLEHIATYFYTLRMLYSDEYLSISLPISTPCACYIQMSTWAYPYLFLHPAYVILLYSDEYLSISLPISTPCVCYIQMSTWAYPYLFLHLRMLYSDEYLSISYLFLHPAYVIFRWVLEHIPTYFYTLRMLYSDEYLSISLPISTPCVCYIQISTWAYPYLFLHPAYVIFRWVLEHIPTYFYILRMLYSDEYLSISLPISTPCVFYIQMSTWAYPYLFLQSTPCVCYIQMSTWAYRYLFLHPAYVIFKWVLEHIPTYFYILRMLYSDEYLSISLPISTPCVGMLYSDEYLSISLPISTPCICYIQMSTWAYPYLFLHPAYVIFRWVLEHIPTYFYTLRMLYSDEYLSISLPISTPCVCYIQMSTWAYPYLFLHPAYVIFRWVLDHIPTYFYTCVFYIQMSTWAYPYLFLQSTPCVCYIQMSTWAYPYLFLHPAYVIFRWVLEHIPTYFYTLRMLYSDEYLSISLPISTPCVCNIQMSTWAYPYLFLHLRMLYSDEYLSISLPISTPCVCYIQMSTWAYSYLFLHPAYVIFRWVLEHIPTYFYILRMLYSDEYLSISLPISTPCVCYIQMSTWAYPYLFLHPAYVIFRWVLEHIPTYFYTLRMLYSDEYLSISLPISTPCVCYIQMSTWAYPYLFLHPAYVIFRWVLEHIPTYFYTLRMLYCYIQMSTWAYPYQFLHPAYVIFRWVLEHIPTYFYTCVCYIQMSTWAYPTYFYTLHMLFSDEYLSISLPISTPCVCYIQMSTWAYPYLFLHPAYVIFRLVLEHIPTYFYTLRMLYSDEYLSISLPISTSCVCYIQMSTWAYPYLFLHPAYFIFRWILEHIPTYFYSLHPA